MKIRYYYKKKNYFIYEAFYTNLMLSTKQKSRSETQNTHTQKKTQTKTFQKKHQLE